MNCPYCNQEMKCGRLYGSDGHAVFWLPDHTEYQQWGLSRKKIESHGGIVLDSVSKIGFFSKEKPESYWCSHCRVFITKMDQD